MRDQRFRGIKRVLVIAQYGPGGLVADGEASAGLCREVAARARIGAPVAVECVPADVRTPDAPDALKLIVQASVTAQPGGGRLFAATARTEYEGGLEPSREPFGAAPTVSSFARRGSAIDAALDQILPWRRSPGADTEYNRE